LALDPSPDKRLSSGLDQGALRLGEFLIHLLCRFTHGGKVRAFQLLHGGLTVVRQRGEEALRELPGSVFHSSGVHQRHPAKRSCLGLEGLVARWAQVLELAPGGLTYT